MALPDLTDLKVNETYQRLLQISSSGDIADGTGSLFTPPNAISASYATSASYEINYETSSSYADTASYVNTLNQDVNITGSLNTTGSFIAYLPEGNATFTTRKGKFIVTSGDAGYNDIRLVAGGYNTGGGSTPGLYYSTTNIIRRYTAGNGPIQIGKDSGQYVTINKPGYFFQNQKAGLEVHKPADSILGLLVSGSTQITGSLTVRGNISSSGAISASTYYGDGSQLTGISSGITWVETTQSADFTAEINKGYLVDSSGSVSGSVTLTLPSSPSFGDQVAVLDVTGFASDYFIIMSSSININGQAGGVRLKNDAQSVYLLYTNDTLGWKPIKGINGGNSALTSADTIDVEWLVVAGGGGGGSVNNSFYGGGGGGGGLRTSYGLTSGGGASAESKIQVTTNSNITINIGAGGAGAASTSNTIGSRGSDSSIVYTSLDSVSTSIISIGGGGGGANTNNATSGGSGGGGSESNGLGGAGTPGQGFAGGTGSEGLNRGGGGGGASTVGSATDGGAGLQVTITGAAVTYAGGGASSGTGGLGGGGDAGTSGTTNTGGGAGGTSNSTGINGGSGIVILRYPSSKTLNIGLGLASSTVTDGSYNVTSFTSGTGTVYFT